MKKIITFFVLLFTAFNMLAANVTLYFVDESDWGNIHAYAWNNSTLANLGVWPGTKATLESKTMGGNEVYSYTFDSSKADRIIFNKGEGGTGNQTDDLTVDSSKPYYYNNRWNATITYDASTTTYCMAGTGVAGTNWCCGQEWTPSGCELTDGSISYSALPAGEYKFKITNGTWNSSWGYYALTSTSGLTNDSDGNVVIALTETSDIKIDFNSSTKKITVAITAVSTPVDPDDPQPTGEVTIAAIRSRLSINTNDFKDFAGLYVSALPKAGDATVSYEWQFSSNGTSWEKYSAGDGATWDNIRPNTAGYYRCVLSYDLAGAVTTYTSNTLQITHNGGSQVTFSSKLPVILVRTAKDFPVYPGNYPNIEQVEEFKAKRSVDVKILWNEEGGNVTNADVNNADMLHYDRKARMNYRGSSSLYNPKRSYAFVSGDKNCDPKKLGEVKTKKFGMFGAAAQKDWVLYASYPDATYMRNLLTYHQYSQMTGLWGAKCRYVELYIDGSYQGIYVFMDKITQDENRVNVNEDTGYIVKFDKTDIADRYSGKSGANEDYKRNTFTTSNTGRTGISTYNITVDQAFEIEYPEREDIAEFDDDGNVTNDAPWEAKVAEIKGIFENMEKAILANDYTKLATIIDYDSWADYFIMNEFSRNADAYRISCVFTINSATDKIVANPMWDYELGWGNQDTKTTGLMVEDDQYYEDDFPTPFWWIGKGKSGCNGILGDCKFRAKVLERWEKHIGTNGALNSTVLNTKIDSLQAALSGSSRSTSVSTSSLKSWVTNRTSGLNSVISAWETCPVPEISDLVAPEFAKIYVGETVNGTATFSVQNATDVEVVLSGDDVFSVVSEANGAVEIKFDPTEAGTFAGTLTITADGVVTETINFSASAILKPEISDLVAPVFGEIYVGENAISVATFSVQNASDVEVELAGEGFSIVSEANGAVEIKFAPTEAGTFAGTLTITADGVVTETINFSATAILKPVISDLVAPVFTEIYVGETANGTATFSVANASEVEVVLSGDDAFSIVSEVDGVVEVEFAPSAAGTFNGVLTITADNVVTEIINFSASAILKPVISDLVAPVFTQIYVGETATGAATFSIENATDVEVELSGEAFSILNEADGSVEIVFTPTTAGTFNGALTITADNVVTEIINFSASAILKPVISDLVAPVFTQIYVGETANGTATFSVANASAVEVVLSGDDAFSIVRETEGVVEVEFAPNAAGTFNGVLTITADNVVTETINFSATAIFKPVISDLVAPAFEDIYVGETTTGAATFSVENASNVEVELSGDAAFSILSESDGSVDIVFIPTTEGTFSGTLTITADGVVTESINFTASAILKPVISNLVAPIFGELKVGGFAEATATYTIENATEAIVELIGDESFYIKEQSLGEVVIVFAPETVGEYSATLTIKVGEISESVEFTAVAIEDITTSVEENVALNIYAKEGTIYCDEEFTIYNLAGLDVTSLNGSLQGVYLVVTANGNEQISVW